MARVVARAIFQSDFRTLLPRVTHPVLITQTRADSVVPQSVGHHLHRHLPAATLEFLPGVGHIPNFTEPETFNEVLAAFLHRWTPSRPNAAPTTGLVIVDLLTLLDDAPGGAPSPFFTWGAEGRLTSANQAAADLVGQPREAVLGCHLQSEYGALLSERRLQAAHTLRVEQRLVEYETCSAPLSRWWHIRLTPVKGGAVVHLQDGRNPSGWLNWSP